MFYALCTTVTWAMYIRKTPGYIRKTPGYIRKTPGYIRKTPARLDGV